MVFAHDGVNRLLINDGTGSFLVGAGVPWADTNTVDLALGDVDRDGDLDIFETNGPFDTNAGTQNRLYLNDGRALFTDVTHTHLPVILDNSLWVFFEDLDADGDPDALVNNALVPKILLNDASGHFVDATKGQLPVLDPFLILFPRIRAAAVGDIDNDADHDLFLRIGTVNCVYLNRGDATFVEASPRAVG